ncbi:SPW repeat protein [Nocardia sp. NPDC052254]|uniref:SPW repeat domain-containing protein n=1 Tax=Nocardia sp. NPDC052254 TaxID=3155681 RepID=UPI003441A98E
MLTESRTQDFVAVVLGAYTALSPIWTDHSTRAMWTLIVLGVLIALTGLAQLSRPAMTGTDYAMGLFGVLLFISPWVMNYSAFNAASWTAWIVGVLTVVVAVAALPQVSARMHTAH